MKLVFLVILLMTNQLWASGSFGVRGGGNTCVEQFISYGKIIHLYATELDYNRDNFLEKVRTAEIVEVQTEMVLWEGNQFIAMNEPAANRIYLSQRWCHEARLPFQDNRTALIAFHELLGLSEPGRDSNYEISSQLYQSTGLSEEEFYNLALTDGRDRMIIQSETYTAARPHEHNPQRAYIQIKAGQQPMAALLDCAEHDPLMVILGHHVVYRFAYPNLCRDVLDFLKFRDYQNFKIALRIGTTSSTIYDVIMK